VTFRNRYKPGAWLVDCAQCAGTFYNSEVKKDWKGLYKCRRCWEPRHPQEFVRVGRTEQPPAFTQQYTPEQVPGFCTPNGSSAVPGYAVPGCAIPGYIHPYFDLTVHDEP